MKIISKKLRLSATDLSNHLACRHVTNLDLQVARGEKQAPDWAAPDLVVIRERGERHEKSYLEYLGVHQKLAVANLAHIKDEKELLDETRRLMEKGADVIAQGALTDGQWFGRPDVLRRVAKHSAKWEWSYEVADTKLSRETKAAAILQLSLYSELLEKSQSCAPESMWVIPSGKDFEGEAYRVAEYAAYFRYVKERLTQSVLNSPGGVTYPSPSCTATCVDGFASVTGRGAETTICRWWPEFDGNNGANWRNGIPRRWQGWRFCRYRFRRGPSMVREKQSSACGNRHACR